MAFKKFLKHGTKRIIKQTINGTLRLLNGFLSAIKKKRGLILVEFTPESCSRYPKDQPHSQLNALLVSRCEIFYEQFSIFLNNKTLYLTLPDHCDLRDLSKPNLDNYFFSGLDALALYGMLCQHNPKTFVEIGSGYSTRFARRAIRDHDLQTRVISVDPYPRAEIDAICDAVIREPIEATDLSMFKNLEPGDVIFIDSSHYVLQNSDVTVIFLEVLPFLKPGVLVHVHDIYIPWDYPPHWVERNYSEQYLLAAMLLVNRPDYDVLFPSYFLSQDPGFEAIYREKLTEVERQRIKREGGSFWMQKRGDV